MLFFLVWRNIKVRYRQTLIGFWWAVFQPLASMVVFTILARVTRIPSQGLPYPIFVLPAALAWTFFSNAVNSASVSLVMNVALVSKVYFPRILLPLSAVVTSLADFVISLSLLVVVMAFYRVPLRVTILIFPLLGVGLVLVAMAIGIWLSAINVRYRDVAYVVPFLVQIGLFLTPVIYPSTQVPQGWVRVVYNLNPMVGVIDALRWALLGTPPPGVEALVAAWGVLVVLTAGWIYFTKTEQNFADVI